MENSIVGLTLLPPGRTVSLNRDGLGGHDDDLLDRYRPRDRAERREVAVVLAWCEPEGGRDPGLLEARLDGRVLGRLDHRTSQQYAGQVDEVLDRGELPACAACVRSTARGVVVELQLPRVAGSHAAGDDPMGHPTDARMDPPADAPADTPAGAVGGWEDPDDTTDRTPDQAMEPVTTRLPMSVPGPAAGRRTGEAPRVPSPRRHESPAALAPDRAPDPDPDPDAELTAIHPVAVPPPRTSPDPPAGRPPAAGEWSPPPLEAFPAVLVDWSVGEPAPQSRRAGPWWIAAGVAAVLLTAGLIGGAVVREPASPQAVVTTPVAPPPSATPASSTAPTTTAPSSTPSAARTSKSKARPAPSTTRRATPTTTRRATPTTTTRAAATPVRYADCASARAAGAAPLFFGEPGYSAALDEDGDGVACDERP
ncbi:MAG: excalibur calcium-binding domain-containing protein [Pseudonocardia sp.]